MDIVDAPQAVVPQGPIQPHSQPVAALENLDPVMDDNAVRQAIAQAEAQGIDPLSLRISEMAQGQTPAPEVPRMEFVPVAQAPKVDVPQKFLKPDGVVDVDKIQASTRQLDEAIAQKEQKINKTVEDYMAEYREKENRFKNLPNPNRLAASLPPPAPVATGEPAGMSTQQLEEMIRRDFQQDPVMTTTRLIDIAVQKHFEPVKAREQEEVIRKNVSEIANRDARVLDPQVFAAITAKLQQDPDLWRLKNPHKAAWLEVKEELRLGDSPQGASAQPSRVQTPVLGGGTPPPSTPSSSAQPQTVIGNLEKLDLRDRRQEAMGDEAIRAILAGRR